MENKIDSRKKIGNIITYGIVSLAILYHVLFVIVAVSEIRIQRQYRGSIRELNLRIEMKIVKAPSKYKDGHDFYGIILLGEYQNKSAPADTIIVGLWPDSAFTLSLAINRENGVMTCFYDDNPVFITSDGAHLIKVDREHFFTTSYFEVQEDKLDGSNDIFAVNSKYIIVVFDTHVRNYGFDVYTTPGEIVFAPWPWKNGFSEKKLQKMVDRATTLKED